jgi:hypothetical protein
MNAACLLHCFTVSLFHCFESFWSHPTDSLGGSKNMFFLVVSTLSSQVDLFQLLQVRPLLPFSVTLTRQLC